LPDDENETVIQQYEVEKSISKIDFTKIGTVHATGKTNQGNLL
jgi:hypothetical protein